MKRFVLTFLLLLALPGVCFAAQSALSGDGYRQALSGYDLSAFEKLGDDANSVLEQLGLDDFDFETVTCWGGWRAKISKRRCGHCCLCSASRCCPPF